MKIISIDTVVSKPKRKRVRFAFDTSPESVGAALDKSQSIIDSRYGGRGHNASMPEIMHFLGVAYANPKNSQLRDFLDFQENHVFTAMSKEYAFKDSRGNRYIMAVHGNASPFKSIYDLAFGYSNHLKNGRVELNDYQHSRLLDILNGKEVKLVSSEDIMRGKRVPIHEPSAIANNVDMYGIPESKSFPIGDWVKDQLVLSRVGSISGAKTYAGIIAHRNFNVINNLHNIREESFEGYGTACLLLLGCDDLGGLYGNNVYGLNCRFVGVPDRAEGATRRK